MYSYGLLHIAVQRQGGHPEPAYSCSVRIRRPPGSDERLGGVAREGQGCQCWWYDKMMMMMMICSMDVSLDDCVVPSLFFLIRNSPQLKRSFWKDWHIWSWTYFLLAHILWWKMLSIPIIFSTIFLHSFLIHSSLSLLIRTKFTYSFYFSMSSLST